MCKSYLIEGFRFLTEGFMEKKNQNILLEKQDKVKFLSFFFCCFFALSPITGFIEVVCCCFFPVCDSDIPL